MSEVPNLRKPSGEGPDLPQLHLRPKRFAHLFFQLIEFVAHWLPAGFPSVTSSDSR